MKAVTDKYQEVEAEFEKEKEAALKEANEKQAAAAPQVEQKRAEMNEANAKLNQELKELNTNYRQEVKDIKVKHAQIMKEAMAKIDEMYKKIWNDEKADYQEAMAKNKDKESRASRRLSYQIFKESFPQMKANDVERKSNALEFDKETELNGAKARFNQQKSLLKDTIKENERKFEEENFPVKEVEKEYAQKRKELDAKKKDELLHAELIFFFKFDDNFYQTIPDDITNKIIQGLGNRVFTKNFRIEVPHTAFLENEGTIPFKVVSLMNYGDTKLYKCTGESYGKQIVVYINKEREIEVGSVINLEPKLVDVQIYEDSQNIRLY